MAFGILAKPGDHLQLLPNKVATVLGFTDGSVLFNTTTSLDSKRTDNHFFISTDHSLGTEFFAQSSRWHAPVVYAPEISFPVPHKTIPNDFANQTLQFIVTKSMVDWIPGGKRIKLASPTSEYYGEHMRPLVAQEFVPGGRKFYKWVRESMQLAILLEISDEFFTAQRFASDADLNRNVMTKSQSIFETHENDLIRDRAMGVICAGGSFKKMVQVLKVERKNEKRRSMIK